MTTWFDFADEQLADKLRGPKKMAERHGVADFVEWADRTKLPYPPTEEVGTILARYEESLDAYKGPRGLSKKGKTALKMAGQLLKMGKVPAFADAFMPEPDPTPKVGDVEVAPAPPVAPAPSPEEEPDTEENEMPKQPPPEDYDDELQDEVDDEEAELADDEPEEEEVPRKRKKGPPQQRIVVQLPPQRRAPVARAEPRSAGVRGILPRTEKIRLYKRDELGKRQHIEDYSTEEIGNVPFETFIRNYVDINFRNDSGVTEYIGYELDARTGREKMPPSVVTIESDVQEEAPDAFGQVRKAMGLITDLQQVAAPTTPPNNELLRRAQSSAAEKGDMNSMMMLLMMERLMGSGSNQGAQGELLLKVLDRLDKMERRNAGGSQMGGDFNGRNSEFGPPPGFGPPGFGFPPPPMYMPPPPPMPPPQPVGYSSLEKVVELAVAQMVKPPKSISEQVQDVVALRQLTGSGDEVSQLKQQLAMLQAQVSGGGTKAASGIEDSLANFEKFTTIVKSVAPQVTGGDEGAGGFLKGLFTSEVGKVLGDVLAKAATTQAQAQQPAQPQPTQQQVAPQQPQIPPAVLEAKKVFDVAQTTEVQVQRFVDVLFAMYASGNERYRRILTPALEGLNKAEESVDALSLPRRTAMALVMEMRPQLATPEFVDKCIAALAMRAGVEKLPDTLLRTNGKWTVDYAGNVLLLETVGAKSVEEEPKEEAPEKPSNGSHHDAVQTSAEAKPLPLTDVVDMAPPMPVPSPPHIEVVEFTKA